LAMTKLIVVVGATGGQGGGVINAFLNDPEYRVRGVTRNPESEKAKALVKKGVEMVKADQKDEDSLLDAFQDAFAIFAVTDYYDFFFQIGKDAAIEREYTYGVNMAKAASKIQTLKSYVWSTLPPTNALTGGEAVVPHFEGKGRVNLFMKDKLPDLFAKTTFAMFTIFAANMHQYPIFRPVWLESAQKWVQFYPTSPESTYPCVGDHAVNSGIFVRAIVERSPANGTYVRCNVEDLTLESYLALWGRASGISPAPQSTKVIQMTVADYIALWGHMGEEQASQWTFFEYVEKQKAAGFLGEGIPGATLIDGKSLLSEEEENSLKSVEDSLKGLDWSKIISRPSF
ncbi:NAD(P)-binding protein, partial [Thozetella sp. PMI_491]